MTGHPDKEYGTNKPPPTGRVQEKLKGDTTCPLPRIPLSSIHLSTRLRKFLPWSSLQTPLQNCSAHTGVHFSENYHPHHAAPEKTLNQNDWRKTTQKLIQHGRVVLLGSLILLLSTRVLFPNKNLLLCQHICLLGQFISKCQTRAQFQALGGVPLPATDPKGLAAIYVKVCFPYTSLKRFSVIVPQFSSLIGLVIFFCRGIGSVIISFTVLLFKEAPPSPLYGLLTIYIDSISAEFPFLQNLPAFIVCGLFDKGHLDQCEVIPHCSFDLRFYKVLVCGGFSQDFF